MKVFLTHTEEAFSRYYGERALAALREHAEVVRNRTGRVLEGAALAEAAAGCQAIIAHRATPGRAETFAAAPDLVAFLRCAVDISTIDVAAASAQGVLVTRATPGFTDAVAELALGLMLDLARGISDAVEAARAGRAAMPRLGRQLSGATLGLIGYGRIAQRLARSAQALGMRVLAYDPHVSDFGEGVTGLPLHGVLAEADFAVCLAIASPETAGMMNAHTFGILRKGTFFLNLARGELVDEAALEAALDSGHLAGAALDVGSAPDQVPPARLARRPDVIAVPHIGGLTREATEHQAMDTVRQVAALAAGRMPEGAVNAEAAHRLERLRRG
ncbi:MAG TPA: NAD(P)-dependent oxidoreductase [Roseomonas sp.]|nr:NAD(P)-dependent oxidoreductase [Roseomonas sp.]